MASRVNTKFVVILSVSLVVVFGAVAGVAVLTMLKSASRYEQLGDAAMEKGDYKAAENFYSRAVNKERSNIGYLKKWRASLEKKVPENYVSFRSDYTMLVGGVLRELAVLQGTDVGAHREFLQALREESQFSGGARDSWEGLINVTKSALAYFERSSNAGDTSWWTLRRFRGIAVTNILAGGFEVRDEQVTLAIDDLEAALKADPRDTESVAHLAELHNLLSKRARKNGDPDEAARHAKATDRVLADGAAASPGNPAVALATLNDALESIQLELDPRMPDTEKIKTIRERSAALAPQLAEVEALLNQTDPNGLTVDMIGDFLTYSLRITPGGANDRYLRVLDRALSVRPEDAELMYLKARLASLSNDHETALSQYQRIIDLPAKPVGLAGLKQFEIRRQALFQQANVALIMQAQAESKQDAAAGAVAMERAKNYRTTLAREVPERHPQLLFVDAKTKVAERDYNAAQKLLVDYLRATGDTSREANEALFLLAEVSQRLNQLGLAKEQLDKLVENAPDFVPGRMALAGVLLMMNADRSRIIEQYQQVLILDPENDLAKRGLAALENRSEDPVVKLLFLADEKMRPTAQSMGDPVAADKLLTEGLEPNNWDPRLVQGLIGIRMYRKDTAGAQDILRTALEKHPDDALLQGLARAVGADQSFADRKKAIEAADGSEIDKLVTIYHEAVRAGEKEEARAALDKAVQLAPDDLRVADAAFADAVDRGDLARAKAITDRATQLDLDRGNGKSFQGRLLYAQGKKKEAATALQEAVEKGTASASTYRFLGAVLVELGRGADAVSAFKGASDRSPTDPELFRTYLASLVNIGRLRDALDSARQANDSVRMDRAFKAVWMELESRVGDRARALQGREQMYAQDKTDVENAVSLADMYIQDRRWEEAKRIIIEMRAVNDSIRLVNLEAKWYADRGDLPSARGAYRDYMGKIAGRPNDEQMQAYLAQAGFLLDRQVVDAGLAALEQAAKFQDPAKMEADLLRGDALYRLGRISEAEVVFRKLVDAGIPDEGFQLRTRLIDSLVLQQKYDEAGVELAKIGEAADGVLTLLVQRASVEVGKGDRRAAEATLDRAVSRFPDEPLVYYRRARLTFGDQARVKDTLADLESALKRRPDFPQALRLRAAVYFSENRDDDAFNDLMAAVEAAPTLDELRYGLVSELLRRGREAQALTVAEAGVKLRPNSMDLTVRFGDIFGAAKRWNRAAEFYRRAWEQVPHISVGLRLTTARLRMTPPDLTGAEAVLQTPELKADEDPALLMARADLRAKQGRMEDAARDVSTSLRLVAPDPAQMLTWFLRLRDALTEPKAALDMLRRVVPPSGSEDWVRFCIGKVQVDDPAQLDAGLEALRDVANATIKRELKVASLQMMAGALYDAKPRRLDEFLAMMGEILKETPDDPAMNNNMAFGLGVDKGKPQEGLPYALKAVQLGPENANSLDTLGRIYLLLGDLDNAEQTLGKALKIAPTSADKATAAATMAEIMLAKKDKVRARSYLELARETVADDPELMDRKAGELDDLRRKVELAK